ncbi:MAG: hypothetical protein IPJ46_22750 [Anaerolineales bacterium]|nr:hypothetical protein [Anaerolineales bacterium]
MTRSNTITAAPHQRTGYRQPARAWFCNIRRATRRGRAIRPPGCVFASDPHRCFSTSEYMQVAQDAANIFSKPGAHRPGKSMPRRKPNSVNKTPLERNMKSTSRGQYAVGWLVPGALRDSADPSP